MERNRHENQKIIKPYNEPKARAIFKVFKYREKACNTAREGMQEREELSGVLVQTSWGL